MFMLLEILETIVRLPVVILTHMRNHMENHKNCLQDTLESLVTLKVQTKISLRLNFWTNLLLLTRMKLMTSLDELLWFMLEKMIWAWEVTTEVLIQETLVPDLHVVLWNRSITNAKEKKMGLLTTY